MKVIETSIEIAASPAAVWAVLTNFAAYPAWNPFITSITGDVREGARLVVRIAPPGQSPMTFRPRVLMAKPGQTFAWLGRVLLPGLFDGRHEFYIEDKGGHSNLIQRETFTGLLLFLFGDKPMAATRQGFEAMNLALKARAEAV